MHPVVFQEFDQICRSRGIVGSVLEVGATPSQDTLLCLNSLRGVTEKVGLNLAPPQQFRDFQILQGNANCMDQFPDNRFDAVLCNAMLEHDPCFWKSVAEMRRVARPGGQIVIGVPGFSRLVGERIRAAASRFPFIRDLRNRTGYDFLFCGTVTYEIHPAPGDYYRFSADAVREVFFAGMSAVDVRQVMIPPRIIGAATK